MRNMPSASAATGIATLNAATPHARRTMPPPIDLNAMLVPNYRPHTRGPVERSPMQICIAGTGIRSRPDRTPGSAPGQLLLSRLIERRGELDGAWLARTGVHAARKLGEQLGRRFADNHLVHVVGLAGEEVRRRRR